MALVGFDDVPTASVIEPTLTTVRQPIERLGWMAVEILLDMLDNGQDAPSSTHRIVLPTELVVRASCGATLVAKRKTGESWSSEVSRR
jgi:LacI family transcriptional regulator